MGILPDFEKEFLRIGGQAIESRKKGAGRPLIFLSSSDDVLGIDPFLNRLAQIRTVIVPSHPGFGASDLPPSFNSVDDLAYFYLDLFEALDLKDILLVGASFGGWIAAQMAVIDSSRIEKLVLIGALGIKVRGREDRDVLDMHAVSQEKLASCTYKDAKNRPDLESLSDDQRLAIARNRESVTYFGWQPYMHDPKLKARLSRVKIPTLVLWGKEDGIVPPEYGQEYSRAIKGSRFEIIEDAGHYPHVEQPEAVLANVDNFLRREPHLSNPRKDY